MAVVQRWPYSGGSTVLPIGNHMARYSESRASFYQSRQDSPFAHSGLSALLPGGATKQSFICGGFAQMSNPLPSPLYTIFDGKGTLFIYPLLTKWYPSHISNLELCIPFNCCECICLKNKNKPQTRAFHSHRIHLSAL